MQNDMILRVTSSPHVRRNRTTQSIMLDVIIALMPAGIFGVAHFGWRAALVIAVCAFSAVAWEFIYNRMAHKKQTVADLSAVVTGLLLAYNLPAAVPLWMCVIGTGLAIMLVKMIFGGIGCNFVNPALAARAILMTSWVDHMSGGAFMLDAVTKATPLVEEYSYMQLFLGTVPGCIGEVSKLAILLGLAYMLIRGVVSWHIPVIMAGTTFVLSWIASGSLAGGMDSALYQLLSGGLILGACFMANDYTISPVTVTGKCIYAAGCGLIVFVIRKLSPMSEGVSYAILFMNLVVPLIDRFVRPRVYGRSGKNA